MDTDLTKAKLIHFLTCSNTFRAKLECRKWYLFYCHSCFLLFHDYPKSFKRAGVGKVRETFPSYWYSLHWVLWSWIQWDFFKLKLTAIWKLFIEPSSRRVFKMFSNENMLCWNGGRVDECSQYVPHSLVLTGWRILGKEEMVSTRHISAAQKGLEDISVPRSNDAVETIYP